MKPRSFSAPAFRFECDPMKVLAALSHHLSVTSAFSVVYDWGTWRCLATSESLAGPKALL